MCLQKGLLKGGEGSREEEEVERALNIFSFPRALQRLIRSQVCVQNISRSVVKKQINKYIKQPVEIDAVCFSDNYSAWTYIN